MKKILIGTLVASSLAMSGDLDRCTEAIEKQIKFNKLIKEEHDVSRKAEADNVQFKKHVIKQSKFRTGLYQVVRGFWRAEAKTACKGMFFNDAYYKYVTQGWY